MPPPSHASTPDKPSPHRRLRLLEARLQHTVKSPHGPDAAAAALQATTLPPAAHADNSDSVRSFSSDATFPPPTAAAPAPVPQPANPRRKYAPPPPGASAANAASSTPRSARAARKRKRQASAVRRPGQTDFFRPAAPGSAGSASVAQRLVLSLHDRVAEKPAEKTVPAPQSSVRAGTPPTAGSTATSPPPQQQNVPKGAPLPKAGAPARPENQPSPSTAGASDAPAPQTPPRANAGDDPIDEDDEDDRAFENSFCKPGDAASTDDDYQHLRAMIDRLKLEKSELSSANESLRTEAERLRDDNAELEDRLATVAAEAEDLAAQGEVELPALRTALDEKERALTAALGRATALESVVRDSARDAARFERELNERAASASCLRLGRPAVERRGTSFHEVWEDGQELRRLETRMREIADERSAVEQLRKDAMKRKRRDDGEAAAADANGNVAMICAERGEAGSGECAADQEEIYRVRLGALKRSESGVMEQHARLIKERDVLVRELRRQKDERGSQFSEFPVMNGRYQLLNLLGKGGFSEVFKAVDLRDGVFVACKIHQLSYGWSEEKKQSFVRHATREYDIHKSLDHARVVRLMDIFEINATSFCTVLELCDGRDLDSYLRENKVLPEKEARVITGQVLSGLAYLAEQTPRIIHYDLKPGNILMRSDGGIQITDFGLSKVMEATETTADGMELTSQGAGTMWYLPPECFEPASEARISAKVDVWSTGVIVYQMLYGRKPFGNDQSQEKMFRERTVQHQELCFPTRPAVSDAAKDFVRKCLTRSVADRPDAKAALQHAFVRRK